MVVSIDHGHAHFDHVEPRPTWASLKEGPDCKAAKNEARHAKETHADPACPWFEFGIGLDEVVPSKGEAADTCHQ